MDRSGQSSSVSPFRNELLSLLSFDDLSLIEARLERVTLDVGRTLELPHQPIESVYFLDEGIASIVAVDRKGAKIEVGLVGREGMTGLAVVFGDDRSPNETFMQTKGTAHRLAARELRSAIDASRSLERVFLHFAQAFATQISQTAVANGRSTLEVRLARWLLMAHDRLIGDELPLTHELLATMLGVRRPGVTVALQLLEQKGLICTHRGAVTVVDRDGLLEKANGAYGLPEAELRRLMAKHRLANPNKVKSQALA